MTTRHRKETDSQRRVREGSEKKKQESRNFETEQLIKNEKRTPFLETRGIGIAEKPQRAGTRKESEGNRRRRTHKGL